MKNYRLSWLDMYGAYRAGKSVSYIASISGAPKSTVRQRVNRFPEKYSEREFEQQVCEARLRKHKGFRRVEGSYQAHDYVYHADGEKCCRRCRLGRSSWGRMFKSLLSGMPVNLISQARISAVTGGVIRPTLQLSTPSLARPRLAILEVEAMEWPDMLE